MKLQGNDQDGKIFFLFLYNVPVCMCQYSSKEKKVFSIFKNSDEHNQILINCLKSFYRFMTH